MKHNLEFLANKFNEAVEVILELSDKVKKSRTYSL